MEGPGGCTEVAEDFAFDMRDWPFEELDDLLRLSDEVLRVDGLVFRRVDAGF